MAKQPVIDWDKYFAKQKAQIKRIRKLEAAINYALDCGIMTERVCKKLRQALKG